MNPELNVFVCGLIAIIAGAAVSYWARDKLGKPNTLPIDPVFFAVFFFVLLASIFLWGLISGLVERWE
jgi:phosphate/sulfate permease